MSTPDHLAAQADEIARLPVAVPARRRATPKLARDIEMMAAQMDDIADEALWAHGIAGVSYANILRWTTILLRREAEGQRQRQGATA